MNLARLTSRLFGTRPEKASGEAMAPKARPQYAFLSYAHKNEGVVRQFAGYLAQEEIPPWVDNQLEYGDTWEGTIFERIRGCSIFMVMMSEDSRASAFVKREIGTALDLNKRIIPILMGGEPFAELAQYQFVNLLDTDRLHTRFIEQLRDVLAPGQIPSAQVQRRRVEHFVLPLFEQAFEVDFPARVALGIGFDQAFNVQPQQQTKGKLDEMNWMEILVAIRERLPARDLHLPLGTDFDARFTTIQDFIDFLMKTLTWEEIRRL